MNDKPGSAQGIRKPGTLLTIPNPVAYSDAWLLQQQCHVERREERRLDTLLLLQHQPVYTLGRRTAPSHLPGGKPALLATGAAVESVNRGGSVTYHGPGQLVGYPILKLSRYAAGPKEYVRLLEEVLIQTLACWNIEGHRVAGKPGLFVTSPQGTAKIASIGVRVERGITLHGFALNVDVDLTRFSPIVPCGLMDCRTASIASLGDSPVPMFQVMRQVADHFGECFTLEWNESPSHLQGRQIPGEIALFPAAPITKEQVLHA